MSSLYVRSTIQTDNPTPTSLLRRNLMSMHRFLHCGITRTDSSKLRIWQRSVLILVGVFSLFLTPLSGVIADQLFHSVRLSLDLTPDGAAAGHPALRSGHVVDINPKVPINGTTKG